MEASAAVLNFFSSVATVIKRTEALCVGLRLSGDSRSRPCTTNGVSNRRASPPSRVQPQFTSFFRPLFCTQKGENQIRRECSVRFLIKNIKDPKLPLLWEFRDIDEIHIERLLHFIGMRGKPKASRTTISPLTMQIAVSSRPKNTSRYPILWHY